MRFKIRMHYLKKLYIFFIILSVTLSFFSTTNLLAKVLKIENIEISKPFQNNFNKNDIIDIGFKKAFIELLDSLVKSDDLDRINEIKLNEIKVMIQSFSIQEEKFIDQVYYVNLGVSFDKKKVFNYLEKKNIFPALPNREKFLFIPILIDEKTQDLIIFNENKIYDNWSQEDKKSQLIEYVLPTEDLEDLNLIKSKYDYIEKYDFKKIIEKYFLKNSIITLVFKNDQGLRVLSRITIKDVVSIKNDLFKNLNLDDEKQLQSLIKNLKKIYDDSWKEYNQINTSIKLPLTIRVRNENSKKLLKFETILNNIDLINNFTIQKFDKDYIYYKIIFNGTPKNFIKIMDEKNYEFATQKKIWILK